jgi:hypothetical protein
MRKVVVFTGVTLEDVASTTLRAPLPWSNSTLLEGDAADAVAGLGRRLFPDGGPAARSGCWSR